jgi:hypothetical protein
MTSEVQIIIANILAALAFAYLLRDWLSQLKAMRRSSEEGTSLCSGGCDCTARRTLR